MLLGLSGLIFDCLLQILNSKFNSEVLKKNLHLKSHYTFQIECCEAKKSATLIEGKKREQNGRVKQDKGDTRLKFIVCQ